MSYPKITNCCLCDAALVVDVAYVDDLGQQWASREEVPIYDANTPLNGHEDKAPVLTAAYCPQHRIIFKI